MYHCSFCSYCIERRAAGQFLDHERKEILKAGIQNLVCIREQREMESRSRPQIDITKSSNSAAHPDKSKVRLQLTVTKQGLVNFHIFNALGFNLMMNI